MPYLKIYSMTHLLGRPVFCALGFVLLASNLYSWSQPVILPKGTNLSSIVVIKQSDLGNNAQQVLMATLQGIVARRSGQQIYIDAGSGYTVWKNYLHSYYGITNSSMLNYWLLVSQFAHFANGYILY